jgi:hypothetical protein
MTNTSVAYNGIVNDDIRIQIQEFLHSCAQNNFVATFSLKRLLCYTLEMLDNAQRYAKGIVSFTWNFDGKLLTIKVSNNSNHDDAKRLAAIVSQIKAMTSEEIHNAYMKQLKNEQFGEKGGAGLGYLLMAKKGVDSMNIEVHSIDQSNAHLESTITISV